MLRICGLSKWTPRTCKHLLSDNAVSDCQMDSSLIVSSIDMLSLGETAWALEASNTETHVFSKGLSSEITQCGFSSAQGNHKFSTHYTYPLHLLYGAPYSKWHLIVRENICSYVSSFRPYKTYCHLQSKWHRAVYIMKHWSPWISGYHKCTRLPSNEIKLLFSTFLKNINV